MFEGTHSGKTYVALSVLLGVIAGKKKLLCEKKRLYLEIFVEKKMLHDEHGYGENIKVCITVLINP